MSKKIYLIDWNSFIYRMFFALPEFATKDWKIVNAIFWMAKFFVNSLVNQNPDYLLFIKDAKWDNFRHKIYAEYKATRDRMPNNLRTQISDIEKMIKLMWIDIIELEGYEADDVIWSLANMLSKDKNNQIFILSWDKDLYSLINDNVFVFDTMKKQIYNIEKTKEKFWVLPEKIIDYLAICWDTADNIPWIQWFWPKKAVDLITYLWTVEQIYEEVDNISTWKKTFFDYNPILHSYFKWKTFEKLQSSKDEAFLSKKLATIILDINLDKNLLIQDLADDGIVEKKFNLEDFRFNPKNILNPEVKNFFDKLEFYSLIWTTQDIKTKVWTDLNLKVQTITNEGELNNLYNEIKKRKKIILDTETTSLDIITADLVWISIYLDDYNIYYINYQHKWNTIKYNFLKKFLENLFDLDILIIWHNIKYDLEILELYISKQSTYISNNWEQMTFDI